MSERPKRGTAKGAPQVSPKIQKGKSDRKTGEDASEDIEAAPPKKQRRTSAQHVCSLVPQAEANQLGFDQAKWDAKDFTGIEMEWGGVYDALIRSWVAPPITAPLFGKVNFFAPL